MRNAFKVAVAGTHSTGKSSFLRQLEARLSADGISVGYVKDLARRARDLRFPILSHHTFESTLWIIVEGVRQELELALDHRVILIDRPVLDALGYLEAALKTRGDTLTGLQRDALEGFVGPYSRDYDLTVVTEIDASIPLGEGRDPDLAFRRRAAEEIDRLAQQMAPGARRLRSDNAGALVEQVHATIIGALR